MELNETLEALEQRAEDLFAKRLCRSFLWPKEAYEYVANRDPSLLAALNEATGNIHATAILLMRLSDQG